jgi:cysteine synthase
MIYSNIIETIGNTPIINQNVFVKLEEINPEGSIKDRLALKMMNEKASIKPCCKIVESCLGNIAVSFALISINYNFIAVDTNISDNKLKIYNVDIRQVSCCSANELKKEI